MEGPESEVGIPGRVILHSARIRPTRDCLLQPDHFRRAAVESMAQVSP